MISIIRGDDPKVLDFIVDLKSKFSENGCVEKDYIFSKFNELSEDERAAVILSVINNDLFHIDEHPDVLNQVELIRMKRMFNIGFVAFFIITYFFVSVLFGGYNQEITTFVIDKCSTVVDLFKIIFL